MGFGNRYRAFVWPLAALALFVAAGCHHDTNNNVPAVPSGTPTPFGTPSPIFTPSPVPSVATIYAATSGTLNAGGGSLTLTESGFEGTLTYEANPASATPGYSYVMTNEAEAVPSPVPSGSPVIYFTFQISATTTFNSVFNMSTVMLPSTIVTTGATFTETLYDQTSGDEIGSPSIGTVSGQTLQFAPVTAGPFNANSDVYLFVISSTGLASATPTPFPSGETPTPVPSSSGSRSFVRTR